MVAPDGNMQFFGLQGSPVTPVFMKYNFGNLEIKANDSETVVSASVSDIKGAEVFHKDYTRADLAFNQTNLDVWICIVPLITITWKFCTG